MPLVIDVGLQKSANLAAGSSASVANFRLDHHNASESPVSWMNIQLNAISVYLLDQLFFHSYVIPQLQLITVPSILLSEGYAIFEASRTSRTPGEAVVDFLSRMFDQLQENHIFHVLTGEIFSRTFQYIDELVFSALLSSSESVVITSQLGFQLKMAISDIGSWIRDTSHIHNSSIQPSAAPILPFTQAAATLIITATNPEVFHDFSMLKILFEPLSFQHIYQLLTKYHPDRSSPDPIPPIILERLRSMPSQ